MRTKIPLRKRMGAAWRTLRGRMEDVKAVATLTSAWQDNVPQYSEVNFENMVKEGWRKNELIFACVQKQVNAAAQIRMTVSDGKSEEEIEDHALRLLMANPNPEMDEYDFWGSVIIFQKFGGRAIYEIEYNNGGQPMFLWPLRPDWIKPVGKSGDSRYISHYIYQPPGQTAIPLEPKDVLDFKLFDPLNRFHSWPPVAVAARVADVDNAMTDYLMLFMQHGGVPPGILKSTQFLQDHQVTDIRKRWRAKYGGYENWMEPAVLGADAEYQKVGYDFQEMGFEVLDSRNEARICGVLDVPPIIVGAKVGLDRSTFANYAEARRSWWDDTLIPQFKNFSDTIANQLLPHFGGTPKRYKIGWDFSKVPAMQEDISLKHTRALDALKSSAITINEYRKEVGQEDLGASGDVLLLPLGVTPLPAKGMRAMAQGAMASRLNPPDFTQASTDEDEEEMPEEEMPHEEMPEDEEMSHTHTHAEGKAENAAPDDEERRKIEAKFARVTDKHFRKQLGEILGMAASSPLADMGAAT